MSREFYFPSSRSPGEPSLSTLVQHSSCLFDIIALRGWFFLATMKVALAAKDPFKTIKRESLSHFSQDGRIELSLASGTIMTWKVPFWPLHAVGRFVSGESSPSRKHEHLALLAKCFQVKDFLARILYKEIGCSRRWETTRKVLGVILCMWVYGDAYICIDTCLYAHKEEEEVCV